MDTQQCKHALLISVPVVNRISSNALFVDRSPFVRITLLPGGGPVVPYEALNCST